MPQETTNQVCPICGDNYLINSKPLESFPGVRNECERCGTYKIDRVLIYPGDPPWAKVRHLVSAWVRRENKGGITPIVGKGVTTIEQASNPEWWVNQYLNLGFPKTTMEKVDALLIILSANVGGDLRAYISLKPSFISEIAAVNMQEIKGLIHILEEFGFVEITNDSYTCRISGRGWLRIDELRKTMLTGDSAFVAMWFSEHTKNYREAVIAAIVHCGYRPIIVDQEEYSGFIMDQVISLLKQARFVIADFTCRSEEVSADGVKNGVRGGVYWESGMAYGLGKPLIHTCEDNHESRTRIHFDVDQYNTIFWQQNNLNTSIRPIEEANKNPTFAEKLVARILSLVGQGSYKEE
ncbi:MAG: hypothetical protein ACOYYU_12780 [Chloroflexota bacterium]